MAGRRAAQQGQSIAPFIIVAAVAAAGYAVYKGYPGIALLWAGAVATALAEPPVAFTGPKVGGYPTPAGPHEVAGQRRYAMARDAAWRLFVPNIDWLPGWSPRAAWFFGGALGVLTTLAPVTAPDMAEYWWVPAVLVAVTVWQVCGSKRRTATPQDPNPGVKVAYLFKAGPLAWLGGAAGAVAGWFAASTVLELEQVAAVVAMPLPAWAYPAAVAVAGFIAGAWPKWRTAALAQWEEIVQVRSEWDIRWETALKATDAKPVLIGHRTVGRLTVDTFAAPGSLGANGVIALGAKIVNAVGAGLDVTVLNVPTTDAKGQPMPGMAHPLNFEVLSFPAGETPNIADPATTEEEAGYLVTAALAKAIDVFGMGGARMNLISITALHVPAPPAEPEKRSLLAWVRGALPKRSAKQETEHGDDLEAGEDYELSGDDQQGPAGSPAAAWQLRYQGVSGSAVWVRGSYKDLMAETLGVEVLADDRDTDSVYAGALTDPGTVFADGQDVVTFLNRLSEEDAWNKRWEMVLKQGANPPQPQFAVKRTAKLGRATLYSLPFLTKQGIDWTDYQRHEPQMSTTLAAAPFVSITGYQAQGGKPGQRHPQGFTVRWSDGPVPTSVDQITPTDDTRSNQSTMSTPQHWIIAGMVNAAFDHARLARPEVMSARPLTAPRSRGHIWKIELRLFDGVTIAHLRGALAKVTTSMGVPWLRVAPGRDPQTALIVAGADFKKATLASDREEPFLIDLDWQQAWADSGVTGVGGLLPKMIDAGRMDKNPDVHVLDFSLPSGVGADQIKDSKTLSKLKGATNNGFLQVLPGVQGAASVRLLAATEDPMPSNAPVDYAAVDASRAIPFATGVDGEHIEYDWKRDPHLLLVGGTGSGKSVAVQILLYGAVIRGVDLYIADPSKGGADFKFLMPWTKGFADTIEDTSTMMDQAYAEVVRRKNLNKQHGTGSYRELPDDVRPPHAVLVLDEFTSLIAKEKAAKPESDDPEVLMAFEELRARNAAIDNIGYKVGKIAREARSAGFTLILATQRLTAKILDDLPGGADLRTNMSRMILGKSTFGERQSALKDAVSAPDLGDVVPAGRGLFESSGAATQILQAWFVDDTQAVLGAELVARRPEIDAAERIDLPALRPTRSLEVEGEIIGRPRAGKQGATQVVDAGSLELSLDELEAFVDDDDFDDAVADDSSAAPADDLDWSTSRVVASEVPAAASASAEDADELERWLAQAEDAAAADDPLFGPAPVAPSPDEAGDDDLYAWMAAQRSAQTAEPAAGPVPSPEPGTLDEDEEAVLLLDVDGVITPLTDDASSGWGETAMVDAGMLGAVPVWPDMLTALGAGPWRRAWLTPWETGAQDYFGHLFDAEVIPAVTDRGNGWWKLDALAAFLDASPEVRRAVWVDREADKEATMGLTAREIAEQIAQTAGIALTVIVPSGSTLTRDDVAAVHAALGTTTAAAPVPVETAPAPTPSTPAPADDLFTAPVTKHRLPDPFAD